MPAYSQASIFSFVNDIFSSAKAASITETPITSQAMPLLQAAVNSNPNPSKSSELSVVGGKALLAESGPSGAAPVGDKGQVQSDQISLYTVRDGDTLPGIAKLFNVSVNTILWANDLKSGAVIKKDQVLIILPITGVKYTVKKGDTLKSIAKAFNADIGEIISFNNLSDNQKLNAGDEIIIPDGEMGSAPSNTSSVRTSGGVGVSTSISTSGYFRRPIDGGVKSQGLHGHNGVDLAAPMGTPIHAAADGQVIISKSGGWNGGYGTYVVISHPNGTQTLYAHMKSSTVQVGNRVNQGDTIGYIGMTGQTSGPHVHFEVRGAKNPF